MPEHTEIVRAYFNRLAGKWDELCVHDKGKCSAIACLLNIGENEKVLDVACGTGIMAEELLKYRPAMLTGVDISDAMIQKAREKFQNPNIRFLCVDFYSMETDEYDKLLVYSAYPHFRNKTGFAKQAARLLKPGGRLMIAHAQGKDQINCRHQGEAKAVSVPLRSVQEEKIPLTPYFTIDMFIDTPHLYLLSGCRKQERL